MFLHFLNLLFKGETIAALVGAFSGAYLAFRLQVKREDALKAEREYAAIITAQQTLLFMWRTLARVQDTYLNRYRDHGDRHKQLGTLWSDDPSRDLDFNSLTFLYRPERPDVLTKCYIAENSYRGAQNMISVRNDLAAEIRSKRGPATGVNPALGLVFHEPIDAGLDQMMKSCTNNVYGGVTGALALCRAASTNLRRCAQKAFPDRQFVPDDEFTSAASAREAEETKREMNTYVH